MRQTKSRKLQILNSNFQRIGKSIDYAKTVEQNTQNVVPNGFLQSLAFAAYRLSGPALVISSFLLAGENAKRLVNDRNLSETSH